MNWDVFRAYDIRGVYPTDIDEDAYYRIAKGYVYIFKPKTMVVGMDARLSSPQLKASAIKGFLDSGVDVVAVEKNFRVFENLAEPPRQRRHVVQQGGRGDEGAGLAGGSPTKTLSDGSPPHAAASPAARRTPSSTSCTRSNPAPHSSAPSG